MAHAERCPICYGKGQINNVNPGDTCAERWETCHGCSGRGWIEIQDTNVYPYYPPAPLNPTWAPSIPYTTCQSGGR